MDAWQLQPSLSPEKGDEGGCCQGPRAARPGSGLTARLSDSQKQPPQHLHRSQRMQERLGLVRGPSTVELSLARIVEDLPPTAFSLPVRFGPLPQGCQVHLPLLLISRQPIHVGHQLHGKSAQIQALCQHSGALVQAGQRRDLAARRALRRLLLQRPGETQALPVEARQLLELLGRQGRLRVHPRDGAVQRALALLERKREGGAAEGVGA
mmetsp:Transcript_10910/g.30722  ORF Transcript_10910/g.30722 Transcript_10910/m.30722 type:complete len:210 (+) Transcript_10910:48-677(+)